MEDLLESSYCVASCLWFAFLQRVMPLSELLCHRPIYHLFVIQHGKQLNVVPFGFEWQTALQQGFERHTTLQQGFEQHARLESFVPFT